MAGRGRPRKTTKQHELDGTFRSDRHVAGEPTAEGEPVQIIPLDGHAARLWEIIVPQLVKMEIAKAIDSFALCTMCRLAGELDSVLRDTDLDGYKKSGATAAILKQLNGYLEKFGLTPMDRQKGNFGGAKNDNPFAAFLMGLHGDEAATDERDQQQGPGRSVHRRSTPRKNRGRKAG